MINLYLGWSDCGKQSEPLQDGSWRPLWLESFTTPSFPPSLPPSLPPSFPPSLLPSPPPTRAQTTSGGHLAYCPAWSYSTNLKAIWMATWTFWSTEIVLNWAGLELRIGLPGIARNLSDGEGDSLDHLSPGQVIFGKELHVHETSILCVCSVREFLTCCFRGRPYFVYHYQECTTLTLPSMAMTGVRGYS